MSDIEAIREQHEYMQNVHGDTADWPNGHAVITTLLSALTASEARAEAAEARVKSLKASLHDTARELWYCAQQAGADWKDEAWVKKSKPGKAYTVANELLESASTLKGASKTKCQSCGGTGEVYSEEIGTGIQCSYCLGEGATDGR